MIANSTSLDVEAGYCIYYVKKLTRQTNKTVILQYALLCAPRSASLIKRYCKCALLFGCAASYTSCCFAHHFICSLAGPASGVLCAQLQIAAATARLSPTASACTCRTAR